MAQTKAYHHALNIGVVDRDKTHRVDIDRMRLASTIQTNVIADSVGKGFFRPAFRYLHTGRNGNKFKPVPFIAGVNDSFGLELTDGYMRVLDSDTNELVTHNNNATAPGAFSTWTMATSAGQSSAEASGKLELQARASGGLALAKKQVNLVNTQETALRIVVDRGPVVLRIGSSDGAADYLPDDQETILRTGIHVIAFTPDALATTYWVQFSSTAKQKVIVGSIAGEGDGVTPMEIATPWTEALLPYFRFEQSLDVMFVACRGVRPMRIERRGDKSWSVCDFALTDGPFKIAPSVPDLQLTPSVTEGNGTLTASRAFFTPNHVGALFRIYHDGQRIETFLAGGAQFTPTIEITGITESNFEERKYTYTIAGTWAGTLRNQRSIDDPDANFHDMRRAQTVATIDITANATFTNDDNEDNIVEWVRLGFPAGLYTSGEAQITMAYDGGGGVGICRVVGYTSATQVDIEVLTPFKGKTASKDWVEGAWSAQAGWPVAVSLNDGRLWFQGADEIKASVSDAYESFDIDVEGDSGTIARSIALGGRNEGAWLLPLSSLMVGMDSRIANVRASSLDEVITPSNLGVKSSGKVGAAPISPVELADDRAVFVERAQNRLYEITWSSDKVRYVTNPLSKLTTRVFRSGINSLGVQVLPDQRIWSVIADGSAVVTVIEPTQQVIGFIPIETASGDRIVDLCVLPGVGQDRVHLCVAREVDGDTVYMWELMAKDEEMELDYAATVPCCDSYLVFGAGETPSLPHLVGRTVYAWQDGAPVLDSSITTPGADNAWHSVVAADGSLVTPLPSAITSGALIGLRYTARWKTARLAYGSGASTSAMLTRMKLDRVGLLIADGVRSGIKIGTEFDNPNQPLTSLPQVNDGGNAPEVLAGEWEDEDMMSIGGGWGFNKRFCLEMMSPKPAAILGLVVEVSS